VYSCAIQVYYLGDWKNYHATYTDIYANAEMIFEGCQHSGLRTVDGYVPFSLINCPANIDIVHTEDKSSGKVAADKRG
jgi:hypothetical protein